MMLDPFGVTININGHIHSHLTQWLSTDGWLFDMNDANQAALIKSLCLSITSFFTVLSISQHSSGYICGPYQVETGASGQKQLAQDLREPVYQRSARVTLTQQSS